MSMGNRHLEKVLEIFPGATPEVPNYPYMHLERVNGTTTNEYTPIASLRNPSLQGRKAIVQEGIFKGFFGDENVDREAFQIPLLQPVYIIPDHASLPSPINDISEHITDVVAQKKQEFFDWMNQLPLQTNMIHITLDSMWGDMPLNAIEELLNNSGVKTLGIVPTPSRKRIQQYGIVLAQPIGSTI